MAEKRILFNNLKKKVEPEENSVFNNITDSTIENKEENNSKVLMYYYKIYDPSSNMEYYTSSLIEVKDEFLIIKKAFTKEVVSDTVLDTVVECFYKKQSEEEVNLDLKSGLILNICQENEMYWMNNGINEAMNDLKEKTLECYKFSLPNLVQKIEILNQTINHMKEQNQNQEEQDNIDEYEETPRRRTNLLDIKRR